MGVHQNTAEDGKCGSLREKFHGKTHRFGEYVTVHSELHGFDLISQLVRRFWHIQAAIVGGSNKDKS